MAISGETTLNLRALAMLGLFACSTTPPSQQQQQTPTSPAVAILSGSNQRAATGTTLPQALVLQVTAGSDGVLQGLAVGFTVNAGGGSIMTADTQTNASGQARATVKLGTAQAGNTFQATVAGATGSPVSFTAVGTVLVAVAALGSGTVAISATDPNSICTPSDCTVEEGDNVTLTAAPSTGNIFAGWSGGCSGAASPLTFAATIAKTCTAAFASNTDPTLRVLDRVSISTNNDQADGESDSVSVNFDGRYIAFDSNADNLVGQDTNGVFDVFLRDTTANTTIRVSVATEGGEGEFGSGIGTDSQVNSHNISADGRFVSFTSGSAALVPGDTNSQQDVFVRDRDANNNGIFDEPGGVTTVRVSVDSGGNQLNPATLDESAISADGRMITWDGNAGFGNTITIHDRDLDLNGVFDEINGIRTLEILPEGTGCEEPSYNSNGRFVVFTAQGVTPNLIDQRCDNQLDQVYVHDRAVDGSSNYDQPGNTKTVCLSISNGVQGNGPSSQPAISAGGRYVVFVSNATNLVVGGDNNGKFDVFLVDRDTDGNGVFDESGKTLLTRISLSPGGAELNQDSLNPDISADGRIVVFSTRATNFTPAKTTTSVDIIVYDRDADGNGVFDEPGKTTAKIVVSVDGVIGNGQSQVPAVSGDGKWVVFRSTSSNLVANDTNGVSDIFRARTGR
jgi:Divergent InlB B-repeat domain/WD40-like Beta Propeller Repeat